MAVNVIMLGPPGAGKGTQGERFAAGHRIPRIATGDMLRDEMHRGTALGSAVKAVMDRGELVSDEVMMSPTGLCSTASRVPWDRHRRSTRG